MKRLGIHDWFCVNYNDFSVPPKIIVNPRRMTIMDLGKTLTLTCKGHGDPKPTFIWTKDGVPQKKFNVSGYELRIVSMQRKDVGSYRCTASNGYGKDATRVSIVGLSCKYASIIRFDCLILPLLRLCHTEWCCFKSCYRVTVQGQLFTKKFVETTCHVSS